MIFTLQAFLDSPRIEVLESCRKADLLCVAAHFGIPVSRHAIKRELRAELIEHLVELKVLVASVPSVSKDETAGVAVDSNAVGVVTPPGKVEEAEVPPATLPRFDPLSPELGSSSRDAKLKLRLTRLRLETEERERERERRAEYELRLQVRRMEIEADKEVRLKQLEVEALQHSAAHSSMADTATALAVSNGKRGFDVSRNIAMVPTFRESEVDSYFKAFERVAIALDWPEDMWSILLQCKLVGKAQEVVSSLSVADSLQYTVLKESILRAYELVPEAYRQKFRNHKKPSGHTFVEFAREKSVLFDKWCSASEVQNNFESLRQLVLLEDFKGSLPEKVVVFLNEQKVTSLSKAAVMADEFVLTHKTVFWSHSEGLAGPRPLRVEPRSFPQDKPRELSTSPRGSRECFYCHKRGHVVVDCPGLKRKLSSTSPQPKGMGLLKSLPGMDKPQTLDPCFKPFVSQGFISETGHPDYQQPVTMLRDTGGSQSVIREGILPLTEGSSCKSNAIVQGIGMKYFSAPLHLLHVRSSLVEGFFKVAVLPALPISGVDFILGNDIAGGKVVPAPEVTENPVVDLGVENPQPGFEGFPHCVVTRAQTQKYGLDLSDSFLAGECVSVKGRSSRLPKVSPKSLTSCPTTVELPATREEFIAAQKEDTSIKKCHALVLSLTEAEKMKTAYFYNDGLLMRRWTSGNPSEDWAVTNQVVVPTVFRPQVLMLAHDHLWSGHLGVTKTYDRVLKHFFWPGLKSDVIHYCRTCHICQLAGKPNQVVPPAPLVPIPVHEEPFERVIVDCVGPLPKAKTGNQFILTIMCASTRFPEAVPLRRITANVITKALVKFFSVFGLPKVIQTDQGTNFKSKVFKEVLKGLNIRHVTSSSYHPESQGALERFHQTLKSMVRKHCLASRMSWDESLPFLMFAARGAVQESLGFSPAELVFGHQVRGPLQILQERLVDLEKLVRHLPEYVVELRERLKKACSLARDTLASSQEKMKGHFDRKTVVRSFQPGDQVLLLLPILGSALSTRFSGPYIVEKKLSETNYVLKTPDRRQKTRVCHVNRMKRYCSREGETLGSTASSSVSPVVPIATAITESSSAGLGLCEKTPGVARLNNSEILSNLPLYLSHLSDCHRNDIQELISCFPDLFGDIPTRTTVVSHDITLTKPDPVKQHAYRVNPVKRGILKQEANYLLEHGFAVPSHSPWSSPCLLDTKSDGSPRFCTDFRKVNAVTVPDAYPLPLMDDCIDEVGPATYVTKLDMGYWQVPLTARASEISAFVTPDHFLQYTVMPFGLCNAPATFQRLVNKVLGDVRNCRAYLDDIVVYSDVWSNHLATLRDVFERLSAASLTLNLAKCEFGKGTILYLGQQVGGGRVCPADVRVSAIIAFPVPTGRRELRRFLGMAGYYRRFCRNFSSVASPLSALTSPLKPFIWSNECQHAFDGLKAMLCCPPVLSAPVFSKPFKLEIDASADGVGAVLLQEDDSGIDHPVSYFSKKLNDHQKRYSTIEKEALSLLLALQHFEVYVGSSTVPVKVFTDHSPLVFLRRMSNHNQRLMRWALFIQDYNLEMHHKRGSENVIADALSRSV
uniref:Gypsy retrotransposon integrase-like protein 1 n=1 Tax=Oryzias latipes TaxID=8090 RepID=A0A3B3I2A9_ORYLA